MNLGVLLDSVMMSLIVDVYYMYVCIHIIHKAVSETFVKLAMKKTK